VQPRLPARSRRRAHDPAVHSTPDGLTPLHSPPREEASSLSPATTPRRGTDPTGRGARRHGTNCPPNNPSQNGSCARKSPASAHQHQHTHTARPPSLPPRCSPPPRRLIGIASAREPAVHAPLVPNPVAINLATPSPARPSPPLSPRSRSATPAPRQSSHGRGLRAARRRRHHGRRPHQR
jgi:hypothetical protein